MGLLSVSRSRDLGASRARPNGAGRRRPLALAFSLPRALSHLQPLTHSTAKDDLSTHHFPTLSPTRHQSHGSPPLPFLPTLFFHASPLSSPPPRDTFPMMARLSLAALLAAALLAMAAAPAQGSYRYRDREEAARVSARAPGKNKGLGREKRGDAASSLCPAPPDGDTGDAANLSPRHLPRLNTKCTRRRPTTPSTNSSVLHQTPTTPKSPSLQRPAHSRRPKTRRPHKTPRSSLSRPLSAAAAVDD
jgi:hypothetical protein